MCVCVGGGVRTCVRVSILKNSFTAVLQSICLCVSRTKENGFERDGSLHPDVHPSKRPCTISPAQRFSPSNGLSYQPNGLPHPGPLPPQHYRLDDMAIAHHYRDSYRHPTSNHREIRERARPIGESARGPPPPAGGNALLIQHKNKRPTTWCHNSEGDLHWECKSVWS